MNERERLENILDGCCSCHSNPPCGWCVSLEEDEYDAYYSRGRAGLDIVVRLKIDALDDKQNLVTQ